MDLLGFLPVPLLDDLISLNYIPPFLDLLLVRDLNLLQFTNLLSKLQNLVAHLVLFLHEFLDLVAILFIALL